MGGDAGNPDEAFEIGEFFVSTKDTKLSMMKYDRVAFLDGKLYFISIVAEKGRIKQLRAIMNGGSIKGLKAEISGPTCSKATPDHGYVAKKNPKYANIDLCKEGYTMLREEMEFNLAHAFFFAKVDGLMVDMSPAALYRQIRRSTFKNPITTPFIPEWLSYMDAKLRAANLLEECFCYRCNLGMFSANSSSLENIIRKGLEEREITIPDPPVKEPIGQLTGPVFVGNGQLMLTDQS